MAKEKCFVGYYKEGQLTDDILSACRKILCESPYNFDINNVNNPSVKETTEREVTLNLIKEAPYGVYDISYQRNKNSEWYIPGDILIEIGMAIATNQKFILIRDSRKRDFLLPEILQGLDIPIIVFSGIPTLSEGLQREFNKAFFTIQKDYFSQQCNFINMSCKFTDMNPRRSYIRHQGIKTIIIDGDDGKLDFRHSVDRILRRQAKIQHEYFEVASHKENTTIPFCSFCQAVRYSYIHIYRITENTPAEVFLGLGISFSLTSQPYPIPRLIFLEKENDNLSLLEGYMNVKRPVSTRERETLLETFIIEAIKTISNISLSADKFDFNDADKKINLGFENKTLIEVVIEALTTFKEKYKEIYFEKAKKIEIQDIADPLLGFLNGSLSTIESMEIKVSIINYDYPLIFDIISKFEHCTLKVLFSWSEKKIFSLIVNEEECILLFKSAYSKFSRKALKPSNSVEIKIRDFEKEEEAEEEEEEAEEEEEKENDTDDR